MLFRSANSIDLVIQLGISRNGERRILEIAYLTGRIENEHIEMEGVFEYKSSENKYLRGLVDFNEILKSKLGVPQDGG